MSEISKNNRARKNYLDNCFPLKQEDQEVIDRDLNSPEFQDFKENGEERFLLPEAYSADKIFNTIEERISTRTIRIQKQVSRFWGIAASVAILVALSILFVNQSMQKESRMILVSTSYGERLKVVLPDSSTVILNALSSLSYPEKFTEKKREVILDGEGYFNIRRDESKPFAVNAGAIRVQVLGTVFNIQAYNTDNLIKTALLEGSIAISTGNGHSRKMHSGEIAYFDKNNQTLKIEAGKTAETCEWKGDKLIFEDSPLPEICKVLEREKEIRIIIENEELKSFRITAKFIHKESPQEILSILGHSGNFKYRQSGKKYYITSNIEN